MKALGSCLRTLILPVLSCSIALAGEVQHSVSFSRQFVIYGLDTRSRGAISDLAEQTKSNLLAILRRPDAWVIPIVVNLQSPQANLPEIPSAALHFSQTGAGLKLQVDLVLSRQIDRDLIARQLLRAVVLEMIYRREGNLAEGTAYVDAPDWLIEGVLIFESGRDRAVMSETLDVAPSKMTVPDFIQLRPALLDAAARQLYRAYSFAFLKFLVDMPDGQIRLGGYLDNLSRASNDPLADLVRCFPELGRPDVAKVWESHLRRLTADTNYQMLTFSETEANLTEIFSKRSLVAEGTGTITLDQLTHRKPSAAERELLTQLSTDLLMLAPRSHPILRPIVQQYQQIAVQLAAGKRRHALERLAELKATRAKLAARMETIDDYLNWFEATQLQTSSGLFNDYLKASSRIPDKRTRRNDPLSVYLDALDTEF